MLEPSSLDFDGLQIYGNDLKELQNLHRKVNVEASWTRIQFAVPDCFDSSNAVTEWLSENCLDAWFAYTYVMPQNYTDYEMVVRFESRNDALMFKLKDGHKAWEHKE